MNSPKSRNSIQKMVLFKYLAKDFLEHLEHILMEMIIFIKQIQKDTKLVEELLMVLGIWIG